jgi:iron complex transport system substrate-binding protein
LNYSPIRAVSLQPSVTSTLARLGVLDRVVACTKWCVDVCPEMRQQPRMIVADSWTANSAEILAARPDLVIASVPYQLEAVAEIMKAGIPFLGLAPHTLADVYGDITKLAGIMGVPERGGTLIRWMQDEVHAVQIVVAGLADTPLVYCEEWGKPLIHSQGWVAELVEAAGGRFLGTPGAHNDAATISAADPDVIIAAWCGAGDRVPLERIIVARRWQHTKAAQNGRVYCINDEFLNTPGPTLISGLHALAGAIHPNVFPSKRGLRRITTEVGTLR